MAGFRRPYPATTVAEKSPYVQGISDGKPLLAGPFCMDVLPAHNPKVAGSNPAPAIDKGPGNGAFFFASTRQPQRPGPSTARHRTGQRLQAPGGAADGHHALKPRLSPRFVKPGQGPGSGQIDTATCGRHGRTWAGMDSAAQSDARETMDGMGLSDITKTVAMVEATKRKGVLGLLEPTAWERMMETQKRNERLLNYTAMPLQQTKLLQPSALDNFMRTQERIDRMLGHNTALDRIIKQQERFDRIMRGPSVLGLGTSLAAMPPAFVEQAADYGTELAEDLLDEDVPSERVEEALSRLADQREAILKCVERINESAIAAGLFGVPIPNIVLALMIVFYIVGDVANEIIVEGDDD